MPNHIPVSLLRSNQVPPLAFLTCEQSSEGSLRWFWAANIWSGLGCCKSVKIRFVQLKPVIFKHHDHSWPRDDWMMNQCWLGSADSATLRVFVEQCWAGAVGDILEATGQEQEAGRTPPICQFEKYGTGFRQWCPNETMSWNHTVLYETYDTMKNNDGRYQIYSDIYIFEGSLYRN